MNKAHLLISLCAMAIIVSGCGPVAQQQNASDDQLNHYAGIPENDHGSTGNDVDHYYPPMEEPHGANSMSKSDVLNEQKRTAGKR